MPELPLVERARQLAERSVRGRRILRVTAADDRIVFAGVLPARFVRALRGRRIEAVRRWGKHLWFELDRRPWPSFHFGMTGEFAVYRNPADAPPFLKVAFEFEDGWRLAMGDARRLGRIRLLRDPEHEPPISELGFDPLLALPGPRTFAARLTRRAAPVKAVLLDQSFAAGVGNWIADEVLYQARVSPCRRANTLSPDEARLIRARLRAIVRTAVSVEADSDRFPRSWLYHYRWDKDPDARTPRGEKIIHQTVGGRTTAWVPAVQR